MRVMALVPARGGSKGVPNKNLRQLGGVSLVARAVDIGIRTCGAAHVTTESGEIAVEAAMHGAHVIQRPPELATDEAPMLGVVQHALRQSAADVVVLLQPTQPLRTVDHVFAALMLLNETKADSVVSVVEIPAAYSPLRAVWVRGDGALRSWVGVPLDHAQRRQDATVAALVRDGSVYAIRRETIQAGSLYGHDCRALVIPPAESCNIDTEDDWRRAESMVRP